MKKSESNYSLLSLQYVEEKGFSFSIRPSIFDNNEIKDRAQDKVPFGAFNSYNIYILNDGTEERQIAEGKKILACYAEKMIIQEMKETMKIWNSLDTIKELYI